MGQIVLGAKVFVFNEKDEILVLRRSETHPTKPHCTDLPGGLMEPNEHELPAALRELREETGLVVDEELVNIFYASTHPLPNGNSLTMLMYNVHLDHTPEVTVSWEHESYEWCSIDDLLARDDFEQPEKHGLKYALEHEILGVRNPQTVV